MNFFLSFLINPSYVFKNLHYWLPITAGQGLNERSGFGPYWCLVVVLQVEEHPVHLQHPAGGLHLAGLHRPLPDGQKHLVLCGQPLFQVPLLLPCFQHLNQLSLPHSLELEIGSLRLQLSAVKKQKLKTKKSHLKLRRSRRGQTGLSTRTSAADRRKITRSIC